MGSFGSFGTLALLGAAYVGLQTCNETQPTESTSSSQETRKTSRRQMALEASVGDMRSSRVTLSNQKSNYANLLENATITTAEYVIIMGDAGFKGLGEERKVELAKSALELDEAYKSATLEQITEVHSNKGVLITLDLLARNGYFGETKSAIISHDILDNYESHRPRTDESGKVNLSEFNSMEHRYNILNSLESDASYLTDDDFEKIKTTVVSPIVTNYEASIEAKNYGDALKYNHMLSSMATDSQSELIQEAISNGCVDQVLNVVSDTSRMNTPKGYVPLSADAKKVLAPYIQNTK